MELKADLAYIWIQNPLSHWNYGLQTSIYIEDGRTSLLRAANAFRVSWLEQVFGRSSRIGHRNALTRIDWEGLGRCPTRTGQNRLCVWGKGPKITMKPPLFSSLCLAPSSRAPHFSWEKSLSGLKCRTFPARARVSPPALAELGREHVWNFELLSSLTGVLIGVEFSSWKVW